MTSQLPVWTRSDPGSPPSRPPAGGAVVALVASPAAVAAGWAAQVALEVAEGWGGVGGRIVLADAGLEAPQLASALGVLPGEGLVDALRWGASVQRVARRPEGRPFFAVTAGTPVADGAGVFRSPRWPALCAGFRDAGVTLVALVPASDPSLDGVLTEATHAVVVAAPGEDPAHLLHGFGGEVLGVVGREEPETGPGAPSGPEAGNEPGPEIEHEGAVGPETGPETGHEVEAEFAAIPEADPAPEPFEPFAAFDALPALEEPEEATPSPVQDPLALDEANAWPDPLGPVDEASGDAMVMRRAGIPTFEEIVEESDAGLDGEPRRGRIWTIALILLVGAVLAAAAWMGWLPLPGIGPGDRGAAATDGPGGAVPPGGGPSLAAGPAHPVSEALPVSLALGAFQDAGGARALVEELTASVPGTVVLAVPVQLDGRTLHRVLAGPVTDSAAAMALAGEIALASGLDPSGWLPRPTPKAYQLGEMPDLDAARRRALVLADLEIPAYVLAVAYSDGSVRFRVYAGAFADEAEASLLSGLLVERGLSSATLTDRIGHLPE